MTGKAKALGSETPSPSGASLGRPIVILGAQRTGTSLIGDLVHRWGAYGGDPAKLKDGNKGNPNGYFEYRPMQDFLLSQLGTDYWSPDFPERLVERAHDPECRRKALELIAGMTVEGPVWFWKEPILSVMLPFWKQIWGDAVYIIPVRDPYDAAVSWQKFSVPSELARQVSVICASLLDWQYSMLSLLEKLEEVPEKIFLSYEALVASPREHCRMLCDFLDAHRGGAGSREDRLERMVEAVDPKLRRNCSDIDFSSRPDVTPAQKALYHFLLEKIDDPDLPLDPTEYTLYEGWREYLANVQFFRQFAAQVVPLMRSRLVAVGKLVTRRLASLQRALRCKR